MQALAAEAGGLDATDRKGLLTLKMEWPWLFLIGYIANPQILMFVHLIRVRLLILNRLIS